VLSLSLAGHDRLFGVTHGPDGSFYAVGQISNDISATADYAMLVAKLDENGEPDPSFGNGGIVVANVAVGGGANEIARGIVLQSDGKIVIAGTAETNPGAAVPQGLDTDIVALRFTAAGVLDTTFGTMGIATVDLNDGLPNAANTNLSARDDMWSLSTYGNGDDRLVIHGSARGYEAGGATRDDADFVLVRLTAAGGVDNTFSTDGVVWLDLVNGTTHGGASARAANILEDGSIVAAGYLSSTVLGAQTQQPVIYKVDENGNFDGDFADADPWLDDGVWHGYAVPAPFRAEAYGAAVQSDGSLVTMGYGPTPADPTGMGSTDWVSFRFSEDGVQDTSYGTNGASYVDAGGFGDNGRFVMVLSDDRVLGVGVGRATATERDAMIAILTPDGDLDPSFGDGDGFKLFDTGGDGDHFWAAALSPDETHVAVVGIAGATTTGINDDDAVLYYLPIE